MHAPVGAPDDVSPKPRWQLTSRAHDSTAYSVAVLRSHEQKSTAASRGSGSCVTSSDASTVGSPQTIVLHRSLWMAGQPTMAPAKRRTVPESAAT